MPSALVTGASTGIGRAVARALLTEGFDVYAGVRTPADAEHVAREGMTPVTLDVTKPDDVTAARGLVADETSGRLDVLVNNAGVAAAGPLETLSDDDFHRVLEVNVLGLHRVTRTFLPLVIAARGRVINMGSISGRLALPLLGAYAASKHAVEALTDVLRRETTDLGVRVALIQPGQVATPIWGKTDLSDETIAELPERYRELASTMRDAAGDAAEDGLPPDEVATAVLHAAISAFPKARYALPTEERVAARLVGLLPESVTDRLVDWEVRRRSQSGS